MVAVVSGTGLGLFGSSVAAVGGANGNAGVGRGNDRVFVNTATGNLIIQSQDESLNAFGLDVALVRTYNSQGLLDYDNGDNWRLGVNQRVLGLTGTLNTAGSTITKVFGDGREVTYQYDSSTSRYVSTDGDGAHDTLSNNAGTWTWTDGSNRNTETYDSSGRLTQSSDADGNTVSYVYTGSLLTQINDASGQSTYLDYSGNNLTRVRVVSNGATQTITLYTYDVQNRLIQVRVDLSPSDNSVADGRVYTTSYTYEGTSTRISSIAQADGSSIAFVHELVDGQYRLKSYSENGGTPVSVAANTAALTTFENTSVTTNYSRTSAATPPGWTGATLFENQAAGTNLTQIKFAANGDGFATWAGGGSSAYSGVEVYASRYTAATDTWSAPIRIDSGTPFFVPKVMLSMDAQGNALVAWEHVTNPPDTSLIYARRYDSVTGWGTIQLVKSNSGRLGADLATSIEGNNAVVAWVTDTEPSPTPGGLPVPDYNAYAARMTGGSWSAPELRATNFQNAFIEAKVDAQGNVSVLIQTRITTIGDTSQIQADRFNASTNSWSGLQVLDEYTSTYPSNTTEHFTQLKLLFDASGNAFAYWSKGHFTETETLVVRRFDKATNTWQAPDVLAYSPPDSSDHFHGSNIAVDSQGNAMLVWENSRVYARYFNASTQTWGSTATVTNVTAQGVNVNELPVVAGPGGFAVMCPVTVSSQLRQWWVVRFQNGAWLAAELVGSNVNDPSGASNPGLAVHANADITALWEETQASISSRSIFTSRYFSTANYTVPAGATWSSLALTLYGSTAVADVLQAQMGNPTLVDGLRLLNLPAALSVTTTTSTSVTPYYTVAAGNTWASITQAVYGTSHANAVQALQNAMQNVSLTPGLHLMVPLNLSYAVPGAGARTTTLSYSLPTGGSSSQAANANAGALTSTESQTISNAYGLNNGAMTSTETQTTANSHSLNASALTTLAGGSGGWSVADLLESSSAAASSPQAAYDANGDGFAAWIAGTGIGGLGLYVRRYTRATGTWAAAVQIQSGIIGTFSLAVGASGEAVLAWQTQGTARAALYSAISGSWSNWSTISGSTTAVVSSPGSVAASISGVHASVAYLVTAPTNTNMSVARFDVDSWVAPVSVLSASPSSKSSIATDAQGNVTVVWATSGNSINARRFTISGSTGAWNASTLLESSSTVAEDPIVRFDANGNGIAVWRQGSDVFARRFTAATNTWAVAAALDTGSDAVSALSLSMDSVGNALVAWVQSDGIASSVYGSRFDVAVSAWSGAATVESSPAAVSTTWGSVVASISGNTAAVAWVQADGAANSAYAARLTNGTWGAVQPLESSAAAAGQPYVVSDTQGNIEVVWQQSDGTANSIYHSRFSSGGSGASYYVIPTGSTWQSLASTLYGVNSVAAGSALQTALGNPALTAGDQLTNLPATLSVTTTTIVSVPAYFTVPASATWQSLASTLYGVDSPAAGSALQSALGNPALTTGAHLTNLPATLTVSTTTTVGVPPYYLVQSGNTWASIAQAIYGTSTAGAVVALQAALGNPTLTTGMKLVVPATLTYSTGTSGSPYLQTDVQDALGLITTYIKNASGRLTSVLSPTTGGSRIETRYAYDTQGNLISVTEDPSGLNRVTTLTYDPSGNLLSTRDAKGGTVTRTYDINNQLLTETRYLVNDPDGAGSAQASGALTARYVYDSESHLRFTITAQGRVTEYRYNAAGQRTSSLVYGAALYTAPSFAEGDLTTWAAGQNLQNLQRVDYMYDFRGNVQTAAAWDATDTSGAGTGTASVTRYVYDQRGMLLQIVEPRGEATAAADDYLTNFTYDGLGRQLSTSQWVAGGATRTTVTDYDDVNNRTITTINNGPNTRVTTSTYNRTGELTSVVQSASGGVSAGMTAYTYDAGGRLRIAMDQTGIRQFYLYDELDRKIASVDADGSLIEYVYNRAGQVVKTIEYAGLLNAATLASLVDAQGVPSDVPLATLRTAAGGAAPGNRITRNVYDASGVLIDSIDAAGAVTRNIYDGAGRLTTTVQYANFVTIAASVDELLVADVQVVLDPNNDRQTRYFYDADGKLLGTLDGAGYLVEYQYDPAGYLLRQIGYATRTNAAYWLAGPLETLLSTTSADPAHDVISHFFHDGQGRQTGVLDAEGYLTETIYDLAGHVGERTRYDQRLTYLAADTVATLKQRVAGTALRARTSYQYDGAGQLTTETLTRGTATLTSSTTTGYTYDSAGNLLSKTVAQGTAQARTAQIRYDFIGRVTQELTPEGEVALVGANDPVAIENIWNRYGITYAYDAAGRKTSATVRPNDAQTNVTLYFYDADNHLRFEVNARGERVEYLYNALGQVQQEKRYTNRIATAGLVGGLLNQTLINQLTINPNATLDGSTTYTYSPIGKIASVVTAEGATIQYLYNAFGQQREQIQKVDSTRNLTHRYSYDKRGLLTLTRWDPDVLNTSQANQYDAFGRLIASTDARSNTSTVEYDRLGREIATQDTLGSRRITTYDAFARTLTTTDGVAPTNITSYSYDDAARTMTVTTPENIVVLTTFNAHSQTLSVTAAGNTTSYTYDVNGKLSTVSDSSGSLETRTYDRAGRQLTQVGANGATTSFTYDAANRVFTRTVDADGLALTTLYEYDGQGRVWQVTEPGGRLTRTTYDKDGRMKLVAVDPDALNLRTSYTYNEIGNTVQVVEGYGSANARSVVYHYDVLGRRVLETVTLGAGQPDAVTDYRYDGNGNLTRKIDARGYSTWYVYDARNQLEYSFDALGGVTRTIHDAAGRVASTRRYLATVSAGSLAGFDVVTPANFSVAESSLDSFTQSIYDRDGRERYTVETLNATQALVTERSFDANGRVIRERVYANEVSNAAYYSTAGVTAALIAAGNDPVNLGSADRVKWTAYDLRGRATYAVDALGDVTRYKYDNNGNIIETMAFATPRGTALATDTATLDTWALANASNPENRTTRYWYDSADRLRFALDPEGYLKESRYQDATRQTIEVVYAAKPTIPASATFAHLVNRSSGVVITVQGTVDQTSATSRDVAGRVTSVMDALGRSEYFGYDAVGNKTSYTNKKGSAAGDVAYTWTYVYDANHRLLEERTPQVSITSVTSLGATLGSTTGTASIVTRMTYDAVGNVQTRQEGIQRLPNGTEDISQVRLTTYGYDALGRQDSTQFPQVDIYNGSYTDFTATTPLVGVSLSTGVTFDALGNATRNRDVADTFSYKVYDSIGRVRYEIDALRYVTEHTYDEFGNELTLTRFAAALGSVPTYTNNRIALSDMDAAVAALRSNAENRTITKTYDRLNRVESTVQPAVYSFEPGAAAGAGTSFTQAPTTFYEYSAFGHVIREYQLVNPQGVSVSNPIADSSANAWATTHYYYDRRGLKTAEVDALRYFTSFEYDETGDLVVSKEYARNLTTFNATTSTAPAAPTPAIPGVPGNPASGIPSDVGFDREFRYSYDRLNRKVSESLANVEYAFINSSILQMRVDSKRTEFTYDAVGNQTSVTEVGVRAGTQTVNAVTYTYYDVLGRAVATAEPGRDRGDAVTLIPIIEMRRDAHGNMVEEIRYGAGAASVNPNTYTLAVTTAATERHSLLLMNSHGFVARTQDASGANRFAAYNARGDVVKEWQTVTNRALSDLGAVPTSFVDETMVTLYEYDSLGRRIVTQERQTAASSPAVVATRAQYNAFGEIEQKTVDGGWTAEFYDYDNGGRLWRTNSGDGVDKVYLYNLNGQATAEIRSSTLDLASYTNVQTVNGLAGTMRSETRYDLAGRAVEQRAPQFEIAAPQDLIDAQPAIDTLPTASPPNAVYQYFEIPYDDYAGGWGGAGYILNPVSWADGGGYYQVSPSTAANPYGTYARVAEVSYQLSNAKQFHWQKPAALDVVATFQYWPLSNPSAVTSLNAWDVSPGQVGVNIDSLAGNSYGYRISYRRTGASSDFATQEGTFNTTSGQVTAGASAALQSQIVTPTTVQSLDRWGNAISVQDAAGNITQYRYNQLNQLVHTLMPNVRVMDTRFSIEEQVRRPQTSNFYDLHGRLLETRDAMGNTARATYNAVGQLVRQQNADHFSYAITGSIKTNVYDIYGNLLQATDELGYQTRNVYDKADNLIQVAREIDTDGFASSFPSDTSAANAADVVWENYLYDQAGRRIAETNGEGETTHYWYDLRGNLIRRRTPRNYDTAYVYDAFDRKISETDANQSYTTWSYDAFGRMSTHRELVNESSLAFLFQTGGATYQYDYDQAGLLESQTSDLGQNRVYSYDAAGHLKAITENSTAAAGSGLASLNRTSTFNYDAAGRKARERVVIDGRVHQDTRIEYDALGRIASLDDPDYRLTYSYDANGNRTLIQASYLDHQLVSKSQELYYRYDEMNRVKISQGVRTAGAVPDVDITGNQGAILTYDAKGQRTSVRTHGNRFEIVEYLQDGVYQFRTVADFTPTDGLASEYYAYDGLGRLVIISRESDKIVREISTGNVVGGEWSSTPISQRSYDKASRQLTEINSAVDGPDLVDRTTVTVYDDDGRAITQSTSKGAQLESVVTYGDAGSDYWNWYAGYDAASVLRGYKVDVYQNGSYRYTTTYTNSYRLGEGYSETGQSASSAGTQAPLSGSTSRLYNVNGELVQFTDTRDLTRTRYFANNAYGQALTTIQGQFDGVSGRMTVAQAWDAAVDRSSWAGVYNAPKAQHFFFADNNYTGSFGQLQGNGAFEANFDVNYTPVSKDYPASVPSQVIVQAGDTLRTIAARVFGDAALWYVIAQENGLNDPNAVLTEGTALRVPNEVVSISNKASSFKPFDVSEALGDTSPTQPTPPAPKPKKKGCGVIGMILMVVVAVVVTVFTAGLAAPGVASGFGAIMSAGAGALAGGSITAAIVGGAVGSIVSQGVGIAIGAQDGFDWKGVALGAIGAGVTAGLGSLVSGGNAVGTVLSGARTAHPVLLAAGNAAANSAITQGIAVATGLQQKFSWRDVAISAVAGPIAQAAGEGAGGLFKSEGISKFANQFAAGVTGSAVRGAFGGKIDMATILADSFGNALGNSTVDRLIGKSLPGSLDSDLQKSFADTRANIEAELSGMEMPTLDVETGSLTSNPVSVSRDAHEDAYDMGLETLEGQTGDALEISEWLPGGIERDSGEFSDAPIQLYPGRFLDEAGGLINGFVGDDEFGFELTGGIKASKGGGKDAAGRSLDLSINPRATSALDLFAEFDPTGMGAAYRDSADAAAFMNELGLKAEIEKLKSTIGRSGLKVPTPQQLGAFPGIYGDGSVRRDLAAELNAYRDAVRLVGLQRQGIIDLDFQTYQIRTIGTAKLTPQQFVDEIEARYSRTFSAGVMEGQEKFENRMLRYPLDMPEQLQVGLYADNRAKGSVRAYVQSIGVPEGPGQLIALDRWLYDPLGSGLYTKPDVYMNLGPGMRPILDGKAMSYKNILSSRSISMQFENYYRYGGTSVKAITENGSLHMPRTPVRPKP